MKTYDRQEWRWIWPDVGPTPIQQGLDSEVFDSEDHRYNETLVREAIQNSLDARRDPNRPARMHFTFHRGPVGAAAPFLAQLMAYRQQAALPIPSEWNDGEIRWLVVEDFNTTGLRGDLSDRRSDFWNYWLNFGISNKDGRGRGGRGIGRVTFLIASQINSVIGYTRRAEDSALALCGMAARLYKSEGSLKSTHAYLANEINGNIYALHDTPEFYNDARQAFGFTGYQGFDDSGLALVIPYPHSDLHEEGILAAAIENFAPAFFSNSLELKVGARVLNASTIETTAREGDVAECINNDAIKADVDRYLGLVRRALNPRVAHRLFLRSATTKALQEWRKTPDIEDLQHKVTTQDIAIKLSFPLRKDDERHEVSLHAVIGPAARTRKPLDQFFREGMSLPNVKASSPGALDLVLLVRDGLLAQYLNCCEGKAHLDLLRSQEVRAKLKEKGFGGLNARHLVKSLPRELRRLLTPETTKADASVFARYFSKPSQKPDRVHSAGKPKGVPPLPKQPPGLLRIKTLEDGLRVRADPDFQDWPVDVSITIAYADGTSRPKWSAHDFTLEKLTIEHQDCHLECENNQVRALNCGPDTVIKITGFDANRELDTNIKAQKSA
ncbi:MAG: hypothetical protein GDA40_03495 [Rhodobacteraceae bacterium]|nr:hypothetical protein [Paracoccaceae bacterium]